MNVKRFTARTSRDALGLVKQAFGQEAVVLSTRPCAEGVEVLAMPPDAVPTLQVNTARSSRAAPSSSRPALPSPTALADSAPAKDAERLSMSTLSFQDYVRERMLRRRKAEMQSQADKKTDRENEQPTGPPTASADSTSSLTAAGSKLSSASSPMLGAAAASVRLTQAVQSLATLDLDAPAARSEKIDPLTARSMAQTRRYVSAGAPAPELAYGDEQDFRPYGAGEPPMLHAMVPVSANQATAIGPGATQVEAQQMLRELRDMRELIEQRFGALAYQEKMQRDPRKAQLLLRLLQAGLSPALTRRLCDHLPAEGDAAEWAAGVMERNLQTSEREPALEDAGGIYAFVGPTGAGKTACVAKLASAFAARHGAGQLGLITLDVLRAGANEQLRTYGKVLGLSVHTAHDRASLDDLLELLSAKKLVLIDTSGLAPHDERTRDMLQMLGHRSMRRLLVLNATSQGEMLDDVISAYRGNECHGIVLSKVDEAVKLGPSLDAAMRHKLKICAVTNGQRVPEDWHRLGAHALIQRAMRSRETSSWRLQPDDVNLVFMNTHHGKGPQE
jgi:flagellar biosynthesis protein FlhF